MPTRLHASRRTTALGLLLTVAGCTSGVDPTPAAPASPRASLSAGAAQALPVASPGVRNASALARRAGDVELRTGATFATAVAAFSNAIISNGTIQLGLHPEGHLNVPGGTLSSGTDATPDVGLRYLPTNGEGTAPGCLCEGWGVAEGVPPGSIGTLTGYTNADEGGPFHLIVDSFTATATSAVSVVRIKDESKTLADPESERYPIRVTHDYHPSPATPNLYEVTVTIQNLSSRVLRDVRYRRVMDWDIAPNTFSEVSTIRGAIDPATGAYRGNVLFTSNNGFDTSNPLQGRTGANLGRCPFRTGDFTDLAPCDQGALFDFGFGGLPSGGSKQFRIFYGAAANEAAALLALSQAGAEVYSLGQPDIAYNGSSTTECSPWTPTPGLGAPAGPCGAQTGKPHTFIFAFASVGSAPVVKPVDVVLNIQPNPVLALRTNYVYVYVPSTATFDATKIAPGSATLGNESDPDARIAGGTAAPMFLLTDFNKDGRQDVALIFRRADLQATGDLTAATRTLVLRASHQTLGLIRAAGPVAVSP